MMATGPEHFLKSIASLPLIHEETDGAWAIARAIESLTHATLALAAATALAATNSMPGCDSQDWFRTVTCATGEGPDSASEVEHVDYAEAEAVREIEREMAIEAGDDSEIDQQVAEDDARFERAVWLLQQEAKSEAAQEAWTGQRETAVDEALDARDAESEA